MKTEHNRRGVTEIITERFIAELGKGVAPWAQGFASIAPCNAVTGKAYRGINYFLLSMLGIGQALTYKAAQAAGGNVKKGAKGVPVVFWKWLEDKKDAAKKVPFLRYYTVFNVADCEGVKAREVDNAPGKDNARIATAEELFAKVQSVAGFSVANGGNQPSFCPATNTLAMPEFERWAQSARFYKTLFHECGHALGKVVGHEFSFGGEAYAKEELVAELFASVCLANLGINSPDAWDNSVAYVQGWSKRLGEEPQMIINAAQQAQKRLDLIFAQPATETEEAGEE